MGEDAENAYNESMGVQHRDISPEKQGKPVVKGGALWHKLPRLLNLSAYEAQAGERTPTVDYEPIHLHITPGEVHPVAALQSRNGAGGNRKLDLETFRFIMEQVPTVRTVEFSGRTDPFRNEHLLKLVDYAYKFNGAECTVITEGFLLPRFTEAILSSALHSLVIRIHAHRPSAYAQMTGLNPSYFVTLRDNVIGLIQRKRELGGKVEVDLAITVDRHNYTEMAAMIAFAEGLGVDGVRFENYFNPNTPGVRSDRSLYTDQKPVLKYFEELRQTVTRQTRLAITLPRLLDPDMRQHRHCLDPFTTVSVDADCNVSGCPRQLLTRGRMAKIWDETFWNDSLYQWLRSVHGSRGKASSCGSDDVPLPCQNCPRNMPR